MKYTMKAALEEMNNFSSIISGISFINCVKENSKIITDFITKGFKTDVR